MIRNGQNIHPAIVAWNEAIQAKLNLGMTRQAAIRAVVAEDPSLHKLYLEAYNRQRGVGSQSSRWPFEEADDDKNFDESAHGGASKTYQDPIAAWDAALAVKLKVGQPRARAVATLVREHPSLHKQYVQAYNATRGR